jgi:hypothetical protein
MRQFDKPAGPEAVVSADAPTPTAAATRVPGGALKALDRGAAVVWVQQAIDLGAAGFHR